MADEAAAPEQADTGAGHGGQEGGKLPTNQSAIDAAAELFAAAVQVDGGQAKPGGAEKRTSPLADPDEDDAAPQHSATVDASADGGSGDAPPPGSPSSDGAASPTNEKPRSSQQAAQRRRERTLRQEQQKLERERAEVLAERERIRGFTTEMETADEMAVLARVAKQRGVTVASLLQRGAALIAGKTPPEPVKPKTDPEVEAVRRELAEMKRQTAEREAAAQDAAWKSAVGQVSRDETTFPRLSALSEKEVGDAAHKVWSDYFQQTGVAPDYQAVLEHLEAIEAARFRTHSEAQAKRNGNRDPAGRNGSGGSRAPAAGTPAERAPSRTISNSDAAQPARSHRQMSDQEKLDWAGELFNARE